MIERKTRQNAENKQTLDLAGKIAVEEKLVKSLTNKLFLKNRIGGDFVKLKEFLSLRFFQDSSLFYRKQLSMPS